VLLRVAFPDVTDVELVSLTAIDEDAAIALHAEGTSTMNVEQVRGWAKAEAAGR
jgi:predicted urease superfamily metal-dependent hydrolase